MWEKLVENSFKLIIKMIELKLTNLESFEKEVRLI